MGEILKIAIVEDSLIDQDILGTFIKEFLFEKSIAYETVCFSSGKDFLASKDKFSLIFLDMYLPDIIGIDVLKQIRERGDDVQVVFSTSSKEFIEQSYEEAALHYLVKPVTKEKINLVLNKFLNLQSSLQTVALKVGRDKENYQISSIKYLESYSHKCILHIASRDIEISESITDVENKFSTYDFIKVNRTTIVNMAFIKEITSTDVILEGNIYVSISRNSKSEIKTKISKYLNSK